MEKFRVLDISGDIGLKAYGKSIQDAFLHAAIGMYSLITDLRMIKEKRTIDITVESYSLEGLFVSWLNELIFHFDAYGFIGRKIQFRNFSDNKLRASVTGEDFNPERHEGKILIKAATYHKLKIQEVNDIWEIEVIFDI